jgi:hypothetical protein
METSGGKVIFTAAMDDKVRRMSVKQVLNDMPLNKLSELTGRDEDDLWILRFGRAWSSE